MPPTGPSATVPELPEVETVRQGLQQSVTGARVRSVAVYRDRVARRQVGGPAGLVVDLTGGRVVDVDRRGKYLWFTLSDAPADCLIAHLGMSGQFRVLSSSVPEPPAFSGHERVRLDLGETVLSFVDQRTFGWLRTDTLLEDPHGGPRPIPHSLAHVAPDPLESGFDLERTVARIRRRESGVKRVLLDQTVVSGVGNIYADESLWRSRLHYERRCSALSSARVRGLLADVDAVLREALAAGGTSFDPLYVNVNGESGWFARNLDVYGRQGRPCRRCGSALVREAFTNRSSFRCPSCQRRPPRPAAARARNGAGT